MTDVSDNSLYAIPIDPSLNSITGNARSRVIGVALQDAIATNPVNILTNGYCSVRLEQMVGPRTIQLNSTSNGNTYVTDTSGIIFTDSNASASYAGSYGPNESMSIIFDAQFGNTIDLSINDIFLEHLTMPSGAGVNGLIVDRLGFQVSDDGSNWTNADISGLIQTDTTYGQAQLIPPWPPNNGISYATSLSAGVITRGWIFPWEAGSALTNGLEETRRDASGNPTITWDADASNNALFLSKINDYDETPGTGTRTAVKADNMKRFIKFYFESDSTIQYSGWDIKVLSSNITSTPTTVPKNSLLYVSMKDKGKSTIVSGSNIKIGCSIMDASNNIVTAQNTTFARINLKAD